MLSYQHAYHAGGPADLAKHLTLTALITSLTRKPRPISYFETHAGRGVYDLAGPEAAKTGEAAEGLEAWEAARGGLPAGPFGHAIRQVRRHWGPRAYPGSPLLARALLRSTDKMALMELHPAEHAALVECFTDCPIGGPDPWVDMRDGAEGAMDLLPPDARRGMVLIDPSYEVKTDYASTAHLAMRILTRWPEAMVAIWYPILSDARHKELVQGISGLHPLIFDRMFDLKDGKGMIGCGMAVLNAPHGVDTAVEAALKLGAPLLRLPRVRSPRAWTPRPPRRD
ncbi:MAG: 23S rRNA (adenine2030-N6)-methyltransferase [Paracoccaceae bacterium]|jgi:23S rRNA (adenine2030-N6)-methyltransferase